MPVIPGTQPTHSNTGPLGIPPGGPWFVNGATGKIQRQSNPLFAAGLANSGWVGFPTKQLAQDYAAHGVGAKIAGGLPRASANAAVGAAQNIGGLAAIGDFFNRLTQGNTWLRVGEVAAGLILLYMGLNAAFRNTAAGNVVQSATRNAKRTAEVIGIPK